MADCIERKTLLRHLDDYISSPPELCYKFAIVKSIEEYVKNQPAANVHEDVQGTPVLRYRPERYEMYEENGLNENGEILYLKRIIIDEKSYAMYCSCCGKRLCSRFVNFCPNCGARMVG